MHLFIEAPSTACCVFVRCLASRANTKSHSACRTLHLHQLRRNLRKVDEIFISVRATLREDDSLPWMIATISARQRLHLFVLLLQTVALLCIDHLIWYGVLLSIRVHTYFNSLNMYMDSKGQRHTTPNQMVNTQESYRLQQQNEEMQPVSGRKSGNHPRQGVVLT